MPNRKMFVWSVQDKQVSSNKIQLIKPCFPEISLLMIWYIQILQVNYGMQAHMFLSLKEGGGQNPVVNNMFFLRTGNDVQDSSVAATKQICL